MQDEEVFAKLTQPKLVFAQRYSKQQKPEQLEAQYPFPNDLAPNGIYTSPDSEIAKGENIPVSLHSYWRYELIFIRNRHPNLTVKITNNAQ